MHNDVDMTDNDVATRRLRRRQVTLAFVLAIAAFAVAASSATAASFTWSGGAALGESKWSSGLNWEGNTAPSGSVETLTFPALTSPACTAEPTKANCYKSENDLSGLTVNELVVDAEKHPYEIAGEPFTLGSGGLKAKISGGEATGHVRLPPVRLGASQEWTLDGNDEFGELTLNEVTGTATNLNVVLSHQGVLSAADGNIEVGPVAVTGANSSDTGQKASENGTLLAVSSVNGSDSQPLTVTDVVLYAFGSEARVNSTVGGLTSTGSVISIGGVQTPPVGTLTVAGGITLDSTSVVALEIFGTGTTAGTDYSQIRATGAVNLANAALSIQAVAGTETETQVLQCPALKLGDVYTLLTTTGSLTGTFAGIPNGTTVPLSCGQAKETPPTAKITYTANAVTATVESLASSAPSLPVNVTPPEISGGGSARIATLLQPGLTPPPILAQRETASLSSGTVTIRPKGTSTFVPLSGSASIPDGSEVEATDGRVVITVATPTGKTVSAEVYGGRFRVHQDSGGETQFILTLPLTGCPRVALPRGSAASLAKHSSGPKSRHLWVSESGGSWGTGGRYVSTTVEGTKWLTVDECTRSEVKVAVGKVKVLDLVRRKTKTLTAGHSYIAAAKHGRHA